MLKVLVVDDNPVVREQMCNMFSFFFKEVHSAVDGEEGLQQFLRHYPDLVVTDITMPRMDGVGMVKAIHQEVPGQVIVVLSAHDDSHYLIPLIESGVDAFIPKPFELDHVQSTLLKVCRGIYEHRIYQDTFDQNLKLINRLQSKVEALQKANNTLEIKHAQVADLTRPKVTLVRPRYSEEPPLTILGDHSDELCDRMNEMIEMVEQLCTLGHTPEREQQLIAVIQVVASILMFYSPYIDKLGVTFNRLGEEVKHHGRTMKEKEAMLMKLFDSLAYDMERYIRVFKQEGVTEENVHRLHNPTVASLEQIIGVLGGRIKEGEVEFF